MPDHLTKLDSLGTVPTQNLDISIYDPSTGMYQVYLTNNLSGLNGTCVDMGGISMGNLSPLSAISVNEHTREVANIPSDASFWAWAYPIIGINELDKQQKMLIDPKFPEVSFVVFGGFVYFNDSCQLIQVNAVFKGNNISFDEPKIIPYADIRRNFIDKGRLHDVTNQYLKDKDIVKYCWVTPDDLVKNKQLTTRGGFIYMYSNKQVQYFDVKEALPEQEVMPVPDSNSPFKVIQDYLKIIDTDYEKELEGLNEKETIIKLAEKCKKYRDQLTIFQDAVTCSMCCERSLDQTFTCGHMFCDSCINTVQSECPICRKPISQPIKLFFC